VYHAARARSQISASSFSLITLAPSRRSSAVLYQHACLCATCCLPAARHGRVSVVPLLLRWRQGTEAQRTNYMAVCRADSRVLACQFHMLCTFVRTLVSAECPDRWQLFLSRTSGKPEAVPCQYLFSRAHCAVTANLHHLSLTSTSLSGCLPTATLLLCSQKNCVRHVEQRKRAEDGHRRNVDCRRETPAPFASSQACGWKRGGKRPASVPFVYASRRLKYFTGKRKVCH